MMVHGSTDSSGATRWRWPIVVVVICALCLGALFRVLSTIDRTEDLVLDGARDVVRAVAGVAEKFKSGTITETFISSIPHFVDDRLKLELAAFEEMVIFSREDSLSTFWDLVPLGTTRTEIRVPATFRYHILFSQPWRLDVQGSRCLVYAPRIRPTLPVAVDFGRMERFSEQGWARFNGGEQMEELELNLSNELKLKANDEEHIDLVRDKCRVQVATFVRNWLLRENQWGDDRFTSVVVIFADEETADSVVAPTLEYSTIQ